MRRRRVWAAPSPGGDLLLVAQSLGFELFLDMYTEGGYELSGSDITSVTNRISSTVISATGTPQYNATGLNSGPAAVFNGSTDCFTGTESSVYNRLADNTPFTLIYVAGWDVPDANREIFSVGHSGGGTPYRRFGQSTLGSGRHRATLISNGSAETVTIEDTANGRLASPRVVEWDFDGSNITLQLERTATGITNVAFSNSGLTPDKWTWGCLGRGTNDLFHDGPSSLVLLGPRLSSGQKDTLYAALAAHHAAIAGLLEP